MIASVSGSFSRKDGALSGRRADLDAAAQLLDVAAHHVHADAAAGNVGHLRRGAETGLEDQVVDLRYRTSVAPS